VKTILEAVRFCKFMFHSLGNYKKMLLNFQKSSVITENIEEIPSRWYKYQRTLHCDKPILRLMNQIKAGSALGKKLKDSKPKEEIDEIDMRLLLGVYTNNIEQINQVVEEA